MNGTYPTLILATSARAAAQFVQQVNKLVQSNDTVYRYVGLPHDVEGYHRCNIVKLPGWRDNPCYTQEFLDSLRRLELTKE